MKIIITTIGIIFIQSTDIYDSHTRQDRFSQTMTYIRQEDIVSIKADKYIKGGEFQFHMTNTMTDSVGVKPVVVNCYTDKEYEETFRLLLKHLEKMK